LLPDFSKGKLCKLLFLADRAHLVRYGRPITGDLLCALEHGPILSQALNLLNAVEAGILTDTRAKQLAAHLTVDGKRFTHPRYVAEIESQYGSKTFRELRAITHEFASYKRAWNGRTGDRADMSFEDLFEDDEADDIVTGAKEEMIENQLLQEALPGRAL
jgi:uncharacterized phage-associated protein